ncbi:ABC transporter ATP-binding protein [bacterium]|nr:ABC transporter ATP-binding protein [bacterium]
MAVIETQGLSKVYVRDVIDTEYGRLRIRLTGRKTVALDNLNLDVNKGEIFGLLGPNGAGKTTTIKILMGIHFASSGTAKIMGKPLGDRAVKSRIGFLPENPYFYDYLKGWEFLDFYGQLYGIDKRKRRAKVEELLALVGLTHAANIPLRGYSKGMNQRIGLAQALMNDPDIVFLDEPQSGLDPLGRKEVRDLILGLRKQGKTVFFSSHILSDAEMICDRVAILFKGKLRSVGRLSELLSSSVTEWEIVLRDVDERFINRWRDRLERVVESEGEWWLISKSQDLTDAIIDAATRDGGKLSALTPRRQSLEDYFISEVKGS